MQRGNKLTASRIVRLTKGMLPALVLIAGVVGAQPGAVSAAEPGNPVAQGRKVTYDVILRTVLFEGTKASGRPWDGDGSPPDLVVTIRNRSQGGAYRTNKAQDRFMHDFNLRTVRVGAGDYLEIFCWDKDLFNDDLAGEETIRLTAKQLRSGRLLLMFDQVSCVELVFRRRDR